MQGQDQAKYPHPKKSWVSLSARAGAERDLFWSVVATVGAPVSSLYV